MYPNRPIDHFLIKNICGGHFLVHNSSKTTPLFDILVEMW